MHPGWRLHTCKDQHPLTPTHTPAFPTYSRRVDKPLTPTRSPIIIIFDIKLHQVPQNRAGDGACLVGDSPQYSVLLPHYSESPRTPLPDSYAGANAI